MTTFVQIRLISLLEEAGNSIEQLETLANRELRNIPADRIDAVEIRQIERDIVEADQEIGTEADHIVFIRYRIDVDDPPARP